MFVCKYVTVGLPLNSALLRYTPHLIHILNQRDLIPGVPGTSFAVTLSVETLTQVSN